MLGVDRRECRNACGLCDLLENQISGDSRVAVGQTLGLSTESGGNVILAVCLVLASEVFEQALLLCLLDRVVGCGGSANGAADEREDPFAKFVEEQLD